MAKKVTNKTQVLDIKLSLGLNTTLDNPDAELRELLPNIGDAFGEALKPHKKGLIGKVVSLQLQGVTVDAEGKQLVIETPVLNFRVDKPAYSNKYMEKIQLVENDQGKKSWQITDKVRKLLATDDRARKD